MTIMIKETVVTLAFCTTLVERHPQPDLPHTHYASIGESINGVRAYGDIQIGKRANNTTQSYLAAMLVTKS